MSKLIIEMDMPSSCAECPACDYEGADCLLADDRNTLPHNSARPSWCPIKGVLPEDHGDLIDRDELLKECYPDDEFDANVIYADDIHKAKAVIAAERSET